MEEEFEIPQFIVKLAKSAIKDYPHLSDEVKDTYELMKDELEENPSSDMPLERFEEFLSELPSRPIELPKFNGRKLDDILSIWLQKNHPFTGKTGKEWAESIHSELIDVLNYKIYSIEYNDKDPINLVLKFNQLSGTDTPEKQLFAQAFNEAFKFTSVYNTINKLDSSLIGSPENLQYIQQAVVELLIKHPHFIPAFSPFAATTKSMNIPPHLSTTTIDALSAKIISVAIDDKISADEWKEDYQPLTDLCLSIDTQYQKIFTPSNYTGFSRVHQKYLDNLITPDPLVQKQKEFHPLLNSHISTNPSDPASQPDVAYLIIEESARFYMEKSDFYSEEEVFKVIVDHFNSTMHALIGSSELSSYPFDIDTKFHIAKEIMSETFFFDDECTDEIVKNWLDENMKTSPSTSPKI
jgi:hypothetical protein